jgi:hypothetical protein
MKFIEEFAHSYVLDVEPGWPIHGEEVIVFSSYQKLDMHTGAFHDIRFYPKSGGSWLGQFECSPRSKFEHAVLSVPDPNQACVISRGAGFWVDVETRKATTLECLPITSALASPTHGIILLATWSDLFAYSSAGIAWSLQNIAMDSLCFTQIEGDTLIATGFTGAEVEMKIDLVRQKLINTRQVG